MNKAEFLRPEVRCDFFVDTSRKKLWYCELEIMSAFDELCKKYKLEYFLLGGSAIGAVRHNGFIPWDDDLDIGMYRDDFDKLIKVIGIELGKQYTIEYGPLDDERVSFLLRIRDDKTTGIVVDEYKHHKGGGIFIEIYPYDKVPQNIFLWKKQLFISSQLAFMLGNRNSEYKYTGRLGMLQKISRMMSIEQLWRKFDINCRKYNSSNSQFVNRPSTPSYVKNRSHYTITQVKETIYHPFEFTQLKIQKDYDECLRISFNEDYMTLPSVVDRGTHHKNIVFYDPDRPYEFYLENGHLDEYFL